MFMVFLSTQFFDSVRWVVSFVCLLRMHLKKVRRKHILHSIVGCKIGGYFYFDKGNHRIFC